MNDELINRIELFLGDLPYDPISEPNADTLLAEAVEALRQQAEPVGDVGELVSFLKTQARDHFCGIIQMGYPDKVEDLKLWKAADTLTRLSGGAKHLRAELASRGVRLEQERVANRALINRSGEQIAELERVIGKLNRGEISTLYSDQLEQQRDAAVAALRNIGRAKGRNMTLDLGRGLIRQCTVSEYAIEKVKRIREMGKK